MSYLQSLRSRKELCESETTAAAAAVSPSPCLLPHRRVRTSFGAFDHKLFGINSRFTLPQSNRSLAARASNLARGTELSRVSDCRKLSLWILPSPQRHTPFIPERLLRSTSWKQGVEVKQKAFSTRPSCDNKPRHPETASRL